eukprot:gene28114-31227_t
MAEDKPVEVTSGEDAAGPDYSKKHKLEQKWTLWFDNPQTKQTLNKYGQTLRSVLTFDTVEDFWCLYNNIRTPGQLQPSATFYLFKEHIVPKWEDVNNESGGCWTASVSRGGQAKQMLDAWWLNSVLGCIGEQFSEGDEVCGVAVNIRPKGDRIELWTKTASNEAVQTTIGRQLKQFLDLPDNMKLGYSVFADKLSAGNKARDRYSV